MEIDLISICVPGPLRQVCALWVSTPFQLTFIYVPAEHLRKHFASSLGLKVRESWGSMP